MVARVVRIENKKLPMKDATKGMQVIGLGDGAVLSPLCFLFDISGGRRTDISSVLRPSPVNSVNL